MSEKRKPEIKLVAVVCGKRVRAELFSVRQWSPRLPRGLRRAGAGQFRVRVDGKWAPQPYTISEVFAQLRKQSLQRYLKYRGRPVTRNSAPAQPTE